MENFSLRLPGGSLFSSPKPPKLPPTPPPPPPPPKREDVPIVKTRPGDADHKAGRAATILTGSDGVTEPAPLGRPAANLG
jgi:hypothetical protein